MAKWTIHGVRREDAAQVPAFEVTAEDELGALKQAAQMGVVVESCRELKGSSPNTPQDANSREWTSSRSLLAVYILTGIWAALALLAAASGEGTIGGAIGSILLAAGAVTLWLMPGLIADSHRHRNATSIAVCAFLSPATLGILWIVALVWSFSENNAPPPSKTT